MLNDGIIGPKKTALKSADLAAYITISKRCLFDERLLR